MVKKEISNPDVLRKIDPILHLRYEEAWSNGQLGRGLPVLLCLDSPLDGIRYRALERKQVRVESVSGNLLTVSVPAWAIPDVAEMDFIQSLEMAKDARSL